jgi:hypothetical protein
MREYNCDYVCELGVYKGENFLNMIAHNPKVAVAIDSYIDDKVASRNDVNYSQLELDSQYEYFKNLVSNKPFVQIIRDYTFNAVEAFPDNYFDFVYIDADHSEEGCYKDIIDWYPKVKPGRFLVGHDYRRKFGVMNAVNRFLVEQGLEMFFLPPSTWGLIKPLGEAQGLNVANSKVVYNKNMNMAQNLYKTAGAYHWDWYASKQRYIRHVQFLKRWIGEKNTLDIGAGDGVIAHELTIRGVDNNPYAIKLASEKGVKIDYGNAGRLPYKKEQFDSALMSDVLEYLRDIKRPLAEARRVIKKYLYVSLPSAEKFTQPGHFHYWTPQDLVINVENAGFRLVDGPRYKADRQHYYFKFEKLA